MLPDPPPSVERTLARYAQRRRQGLSTLSVLVGPPEATAAAWRAHVPLSLHIDPAMALTVPALAAAAAAARVAAACRQCGLMAGAVAELGQRLGRPMDPARSAAERFLFDRLNERWPGLFALNVALPFPFGSRPAEADLCAGAVRLVIEIDGYHHFQAPVCYRRDRRKDWAYQANGYRVVRVRAEDVVPRAGEILDRIGVAVDHCRAVGAHGGGSGQQS